MVRFLARALLLTACWALCCWASTARAQADAGAPADAGAAAEPAPEPTGSGAAPDEPPPPPSPEIKALLSRAAEIRALLDGTLDVAADPATLFSVPLDDEQAVFAEAKRLRAIIQAAKQEAADREAAESAAADGGPDGGARPPAPNAGHQGAGHRSPDGGAADGGAPDGAQDGGPADGGAPGETEDTAALDERYWEARLQLDEASLAFLGLSKTRRQDLLAEHKKRQDEASEEARKLAEAKRLEREAEEAQRQALEEARREASEGQRQVKQEEARLLGLKSDYSKLSSELLIEHERLNRRADVRLGWQRRVDEALAEWAADKLSPEELAQLYDKISVTLESSRDALHLALDDFTQERSRIEPIGEDPLDALEIDVDTSEIKKLRRELNSQLQELAKLEREVRSERASTLVKEVRSLNEQRLRLLPRLPSESYNELVGFGKVGRAQARDELEKLVSVLRYHGNATVDWISYFDVRQLREAQQTRLAFKLLQALAALLVFIWWYRRADDLLADWQAREIEEDKGSRTVRIIRFIRRVRRPIEWLLLFWVLRALMPNEMAEQLEVELIGVILWWVLGEALVVDIIDALFAGRRSASPRAALRNKLRLRALHLVGRVVVVFGLALSLTIMLVGQGTIYHWVLRLCWFTVVPVTLLLLHWYRPIILDHFERRQHTGGIAGWVTRHQKGLSSYLASAIGVVYLAYTGGGRQLANYAERFSLIRRLRAYWFRHEVAKKEQEDESKQQIPLDALAADKHDSLDPERYHGRSVTSQADEMCAQLEHVIHIPGGSVHVVVGERGSGKSTLLHRLHAGTDAVRIQCPHDGIETFVERLTGALDLPAGTSLEMICDTLNARDRDTAILIDDSHHLIRPVIGGLDDFDRVLRIARESSVEASTWIFAMDSTIWHYLQRARGSKPLFDEVHTLKPWSEESIALLLKHRCETASVEPNFERLLTDLPDHADHIDKAEALARAEHNYYRLLWDYSSGNPGIALHFWRKSLGIRHDGQQMVRLFAPPDMRDIERLPDSALFVLRTILQVERATVADIVAATMLSQDSVRDALRYALSRGYVQSDNARYRIHYTWLRAISDFLRRRHLVLSIH